MTDPTRIGSNPFAVNTGNVGKTENAPRTQRTTLGSGERSNNVARSGQAAPSSFAEMLRARQGVAPAAAPPAPDALRFSAHAQTRLQSRHIDLQAGDMERLQSAVGKAAGKGSRDALVLMDDMAFVVSVANRTVVTVVDKDNLKQNVFTNIDSAVIA